MNQFRKLRWLTGAALAVSSAVANPAFAEVGGTLKYNTYYDFSSKDKGFSFSNLHFNELPNVGLSVEQSLPFGKETIKFRLSTKLSESKNELKLAYIEHENFIVGLTHSLFCDAAALPATLLNDNTPNTIRFRTLQVAWQQQASQHVSYAIALEDSYLGELAIDLARGIHPRRENRIPTVSTYLKYQTDYGHLRLAGLYRASRFEKARGKNIIEPGLWGVNLTSSANLVQNKTKLKAAAVYGAGLGEYLTSTELFVTEIPSFLTEKKNPLLLDTAGGSLGVEHYWMPKLRSTIVYGILGTINNKKYKKHVPKHKTKKNDEDEKASTTPSLRKECYKKSHYASVNLTYHPTSNLAYGVEYIHNKLWALDKAGDRDSNRIQVGISFKF